MTVQKAKYPWHHYALERIVSQVRESRLPHGLLYRHRSYYFDEALGWEMAKILLCETSTGNDNCQHCRLLDERTHPNVLFLNIFDNPNQKPKDRVGIKQIRELEQQMWQTSVFDKPKVAFISGMDLLSIGAQNALLKTLEEPPENAFFVVSVKNISQVLPTIMSRVQRIRHGKIDQDGLLHWLQQQIANTPMTEAEIGAIAKLVDNAPKQSLQLLREPETVKKLKEEKARFAQFLSGKINVSALIEKIDKTNIEEQLARYQRYTESMIHFLFTQQAKKTTDKRVKKVNWHGVSLPALYLLHDELVQLRYLTRTNVDMLWQINTSLSTWQHKMV